MRHRSALILIFFSPQPPLTSPTDLFHSEFRINGFNCLFTFYESMALDFLTILAITLPLSAGMVLASKIILNRPKSVDKYARKLDKSREDYIEELEGEIKDAKNTLNSRERGPKVDGDIGDIQNLLPELVGSFDNFAPKWLKPFLRNKEIQSVIIEKVKNDPDKFVGMFSKLIGKKGKDDKDSPPDNQGTL